MRKGGVIMSEELKEIKPILKVFTQQIHYGYIDGNIILTDGTIAFVLKGYTIDKELLEKQDYAKLSDEMIATIKEYLERPLPYSIKLNGSLIHYLSKSFKINGTVPMNFDNDIGRILDDSVLIITPVSFEKTSFEKKEKEEVKEVTESTVKRKRGRPKKSQEEKQKETESSAVSVEESIKETGQIEEPEKVEQKETQAPKPKKKQKEEKPISVETEHQVEERKFKHLRKIPF
jgi:hypothetical protein